MSEEKDPVRWSDGADDAPASFAGVLRADETRDPDAAKLARMLDGLAVQVAWPELSQAFREQLIDAGKVAPAAPATATPAAGGAASSGAAASAGVGIAAKIGMALVVAGIGVAAWVGFGSQESAKPAVTHVPVHAVSAPAISGPAVSAPAAAKSTDTAPSTPVAQLQGLPSASDATSTANGHAPRAAANVTPHSHTSLAADPVAELVLLERAQRALRDTPATTLTLAEQHRASFPHGQFEQEREMLAIEALLRLDRAPEAKQRAQRFLRQHPHSSHRPRLEDLLRSTP